MFVGRAADICGPLQLPLAKDAANILKNRLNRINQELFDDELKSLTRVYRLNKDEFETQLLALSKFDPGNLVKELSDLFNRRYYPSLTYEIIAHMLKHRFVDAVVNFNFDELLDQCIEDELGAGDYYKIVSDGDCPDSLEDIINDRGRFRLPLYIKPHGTASHKSTMRFTRSGYFGLPLAIQDLLKELLSKIPVILVSIGHGMQSFEFNVMLEDCFLVDSEIFYVSTSKPAFEGKLKSFYKGEFLKVSPSPKSLDDIVVELWDAVSDNFNDEYKPRHVLRHRLVSTVFSRDINISIPEANRRSHIVEYLKDRTYVEIAISIAKTKGFVTLSELTQNRTGKYYGLYKKMSRCTSDTLYDFCKQMGLKPPSGLTQKF